MSTPAVLSNQSEGAAAQVISIQEQFVGGATASASMVVVVRSGIGAGVQGAGDMGLDVGVVLGADATDSGEPFTALSSRFEAVATPEGSVLGSVGSSNTVAGALDSEAGYDVASSSAGVMQASGVQGVGMDASLSDASGVSDALLTRVDTESLVGVTALSELDVALSSRLSGPATTVDGAAVGVGIELGDAVTAGYSASRYLGAVFAGGVASGGFHTDSIGSALVGSSVASGNTDGGLAFYAVATADDRLTVATDTILSASLSAVGGWSTGYTIEALAGLDAEFASGASSGFTGVVGAVGSMASRVGSRFDAVASAGGVHGVLLSAGLVEVAEAVADAASRVAKTLAEAGVLDALSNVSVSVLRAGASTATEGVLISLGRVSTAGTGVHGEALVSASSGFAEAVFAVDEVIGRAGLELAGNTSVAGAVGTSTIVRASDVMRASGDADMGVLSRISAGLVASGQLQAYTLRFGRQVEAVMPLRAAVNLYAFGDRRAVEATFTERSAVARFGGGVEVVMPLRGSRLVVILEEGYGVV